MSKGLSPIIATILLVAIAIAIGAVVSISMRAQSQEYMNKEAERRERVLDREGESLVLVHVEYSSPNLSIILQNNGTSDSEVTYVLVNSEYIKQEDFVAGSDYELDYGTSGTITVAPSSISDIEGLSSLEVGTTLGNLYIYSAPSPEIRVVYTWFDDATDNKVVVVSGEGSHDDGKIVKYEWCFNHNESTGACDPNPDPPGQDSDMTGVSASFQYTDYQPGDYVIWLKVTDDTGMVGTTTIPINIPAL
ncbi:MAG: hypothetical protein PVF58_06740 [Candidatus Methanofastidiosia archaeon]|jgi:flagellin-like protein